MKPFRTVAVVGDFSPANDLHLATGAALRSLDLDPRWLPTDSDETRDANRLQAFDGFWIAPSSPYRDMDGALAAIRYARETGRPLVGT